MKSWSNELHRPVTRTEAMLWAGAVLIVSAACAAAAIAAPEPVARGGEAAPQAAIMMELAPEPEAVRTDRNAVTEDRADAAERPEPAREPVAGPAVAPDPDPVLKAETLPKTEPRAPVDPLEERMLAALDGKAVPRPLARPEPPKPHRAEKDATRRTKSTEAASAATRKPAAMVKATGRNAAQKTVAASTASSGDARSWKARVVAHLERRKRYPASARARGEQGTVLVSFRIDAGGRVLSTSLARSSGHDSLDAAALAMVARASPVPAPPSGVSPVLTAPVRFVRR